MTIGGVPVLLLERGEIELVARQPLIPVTFLLLVPVVYALTLEASLKVFEVGFGSNPNEKLDS